MLLGLISGLVLLGLLVYKGAYLVTRRSLRKKQLQESNEPEPKQSVYRLPPSNSVENESDDEEGIKIIAKEIKELEEPQGFTAKQAKKELEEAKEEALKAFQSRAPEVWEKKVKSEIQARIKDLKDFCIVTIKGISQAEGEILANYGKKTLGFRVSVDKNYNGDTRLSIHWS